MVPAKVEENVEAAREAYQQTKIYEALCLKGLDAEENQSRLFL